MTLDFNKECNEMFVKHLNKCKIYGEYGCGASTIFAIDNFKGKIYSVETDKKWRDKIFKNVKDKKAEQRASIEWVDVGEVANWGYPKTMSKKENFIEYQKSIWKKEKPDFVLIDGRFRVACFLQSILHCNDKCEIIIDDYYDRKHYFCVEEVLELKQIYGDRMALFIKDKDLDLEKVQKMYEEHKYVLG